MITEASFDPSMAASAPPSGDTPVHEDPLVRFPEQAPAAGERTQEAERTYEASPQKLALDAQIMTHELLEKKAQDYKAVSEKKGKKGAPEPEWMKNLTPAQKQNLSWIAGLSGMGDVGDLKAPVSIRANANGSESPHDLYIVITDVSGSERAEIAYGVTRDTLKPGQRLLRLDAIKGKMDNTFRMQTNGQPPTVLLTSHDLVSAFMYQNRDTLIPILPEGQQKAAQRVAAAHFAHLANPSEPLIIDQAVLSEAAFQNGMIQSESLIAFMDKRARRIPITEEMNPAERQAAEQFNAQRDILMARLSEGTIASSKDYVSVLQLVGPNGLKQEQQELEAKRNYNLSMIQGNIPADQKARIADELQAQEEQKGRLDQALALLEKPEELEAAIIAIQSDERSVPYFQHLNNALKRGDMPASMVSLIDAKIAQAESDEEKSKLEALKKIALYGGGGIAVLLIILLMKGMGGSQ